jgi:hypothetical protein
MMGYIFYGFGVLILLSCIMAIIQSKKIFFVKEWFVKFKEITGEAPKASDFRSKSDLNLHTNRSLLGGLELMWVFVGLLTNNWPIFLIIFLTSIMLKVIFGKIQYTLVGKIISIKFLVLRIMIYSLMIINHFYLHFDLIGMLR